MSKIQRVRGLEILDSRGRPTVKVIRTLEGATGTASVPSGASTGGAEAVELRDGDSRRFGGYGCRKAVRKIQSDIGSACAGRHFHDQVHLDETLIDLDRTSNKSNLGANSTLAVSLAFSRAQAAEQGVPLYRHLGAIRRKEESAFTLPRPIINLFSGGKHAGLADLHPGRATCSGVDNHDERGARNGICRVPSCRTNCGRSIRYAAAD